MCYNYLRGLDTSGRFFAISTKGDNYCDYQFVLLHTDPLLKRGLLHKERICSHLKSGLLYKERICSLWEQILSL